jgi:hypothetical protein
VAWLSCECCVTKMLGCAVAKLPGPGSESRPGISWLATAMRKTESFCNTCEDLQKYNRIVIT